MFDDLQATIDAAARYEDPHAALEAAIAVALALAVRRHANDLRTIEGQAKDLAKEILEELGQLKIQTASGSAQLIAPTEIPRFDAKALLALMTNDD